MRKGSTLLLHRLRQLYRLGDGATSSSSSYELFHSARTPPLLHPSCICARLQHSAAVDPDHADERGPFSEKVLRLRDEIATLSDEELAAMSAGLRKVLGLPEPPPMGAMPMGGMAADWQEGGGDAGATPAEEKAPEKTSFSVKIEKFDSASKIKVIKEVRAATELGLKEAKDFVEKIPAVVKSGLTKEEAGLLIEKLKAVGATAVME